MSGLRSSYSTQVKYDTDGAGAGSTTLTKVVKVKPAKRSRGKSDGTHLESPSIYKEVEPEMGWKDTDAMTVDVHLTEAQVAALDVLFESGAERYWYVLLPLLSGQTVRAQLRFRGYISALDVMEIDSGSDDTIKYQFEVQRTTDKVTWSNGS